jgi:hypothetical protein
MASLNLATVTGDAYNALVKIDKGFIKTANYMGVAWFGWNMEYKHSLRDASCGARRKVHNAFLAANLELDGASPAHKTIVDKFIKPES